MSLRDRLEKLEDRAAKQDSGGPQRSRAMERHLHAYEQARREIEGRDPLPDLPYTDEDREDDQRTLEETIPAYRARRGWQTEEARRILDAWEQHIRTNLQEGAET